VRRLGPPAHAAVLAVTAALAIATAPLLAAWSDSAAPWADSLGTWASIAATWLMIRKVAANWLWWIVVDAGLAWLFASQGLLFTALLYALFALLAVSGWRAWQRAPVVTRDG
jgi:nicotinamide mononucleotide transporter